MADWLMAVALYASSADPNGAEWGVSGTETEIISPLALQADAIMEAARQRGFLGGPLAIDEHIVTGAQAGLVGLPINLFGDRLGYDQGATVFVIGAVETDATTTLTVIKRL